jgi:hypothetical protein
MKKAFKLGKEKNKEETLICKICLEPIFNYICVDCLESSVEKWVSVHFPNVLNDFKSFSNRFKNTFASYVEKEKCIKCNRTTETIVCPYCYLKEVYDFLSLKNKHLAEIFIKFFNFNSLKSEKPFESISIKNFSPVILVEEKNNPEINICEVCGNQSDYLRKVNGSYICEVCEDESRS